MIALPHGLVHASLLDGRGGLKELNPEDLNQWEPCQGPLWLHFDLTSPAAATWLRQHSGLDVLAVEALLTVESRPRVSRIESGLLLAFRGINHNEGADPDDMIGIRLWADQHRIVTTRRRELSSVNDVRAALEAGVGPQTTADILAELARYLVLHMGDPIDDLEEWIADLEERSLEEADQQTRLALSSLRRQIIALRRYLAPQREALSALCSVKLPWLDERDRLSLRETSDSLIRHLEDLEALRDRAAVTQEELQNRLVEQQNMRVYVLSVVAAVFLPLSFFTGLFGSNVGGIPGADNPVAFFIFVAFLLTVMLMQIGYLRYKGWV